MRVNNMKQVKLGAIISYILIVLNALYGVVLTPYIIQKLGTEQYGVYKTIAALSSSLMIIDLGIGGTVQRYVAKYRAEHKESQIPNFIAMSLFIAILINLIIIVVSVAICFMIEPIYGQTFSSEQLILARKLFILLSFNALMIVIENVLNGLITGYNRFVFGNGLKLFLLIVRFGMIWLLLRFFNEAMIIVFISIVVSSITFIAEMLYIKKSLKLRIKFSYWDKNVFTEAGKYTVLMFLTSIASQIFSNLDNIAIGSICGPELVTIYSVGLLFFSMFQELSAGIAGVMLPTVTNVLSQEDGEIKIQRVIIKAGKVQYILLGAALIGFICIGQDFISVWMGKGYEDVYLITLILIIPAMFELCINVCHSILRAKNKLGFRTGIVILSASLNACLTILFVKMWSYIGAAVATACSYIICSLFVMNIYYYKVIKLPMLKIYGAILGKVSLCLLISGSCLFIFSKFVNGSWLAIIANIIVFCLIYGFALLLFGLDNDEKKQIPLIKRLFE